MQSVLKKLESAEIAPKSVWPWILDYHAMLDPGLAEVPSNEDQSGKNDLTVPSWGQGWSFLRPEQPTELQLIRQRTREEEVAVANANKPRSIVNRMERRATRKKKKKRKEDEERRRKKKKTVQEHKEKQKKSRRNKLS